MKGQVAMDWKIYHLVWGVVLFFLYNVLTAVGITIMRLSHSILPSQTLALMFVGEVVCLLPLAPFIRRQWSIVKPKEWIAFTCLTLLLGAHSAASIFCTQHMNLGKTAIARKRLGDTEFSSRWKYEKTFLMA